MTETVPDTFSSTVMEYDRLGRLDTLTDYSVDPQDSSLTTQASYDYTVRADGKRTASTGGNATRGVRFGFRGWGQDNGTGVESSIQPPSRLICPSSDMVKRARRLVKGNQEITRRMERVQKKLGVKPETRA